MDLCLYPIADRSAITAVIPVGQKLIVGASMYAAGTQQPAGMTTEYYDAWFDYPNHERISILKVVRRIERMECLKPVG